MTDRLIVVGLLGAVTFFMLVIVGTHVRDRVDEFNGPTPAQILCVDRGNCPR